MVGRRTEKHGLVNPEQSRSGCWHKSTATCDLGWCAGSRCWQRWRPHQANTAGATVHRCDSELPLREFSGGASNILLQDFISMLGIQSVPTGRIEMTSFMVLSGAFPQAIPAYRSSIHYRCRSRIWP